MLYNHQGRMNFVMMCCYDSMLGSLLILGYCDIRFAYLDMEVLGFCVTI